MGGILHRSTNRRNDDDRKIKIDKDRRKRQRQEQQQQQQVGGGGVFDLNDFSMRNTNENQDPNLDFIQTNELWENKYDHAPTININDPPGAPRTYSPNYSLNQNDMLLHPWPSSHEMNNSFYPLNILQSVPSFNIPYDPNQQLHPQFSNTINENSPRLKFGERSPKKVHFAPTPSPTSQIVSMKPLTNAHSWHESHPSMSNPSDSVINKPMRLSNRSSAPRSSTNSRKIVSSQASVAKPIYIGIDHQATLAERSKRTVHKRQRKNHEEIPSDRFIVTNNHQSSRSHPQNQENQQKHHKQTDSPRSDHEMMLNRYLETLQPNLSVTQRPITKSISTNRVTQNIDQITFPPNDIKPSKSRNVRRQQSAINGEIKPSKSQESQRQRPPSGSPLFIQNESSKRRIEHSHSNSSIMRVSLSKKVQQPNPLSTITPQTSLIRTRI
ncbi:hypothetical protein I4U23_024427 [Adineta vaga]|nr:hypothetical protein I4U23_024427 [Adineta vaga]